MPSQYFKLGCAFAWDKFAGVSPIPYTPVKTRDSTINHRNFQDIWKSMDDRPLFTGEESSLGMPSAPKTASNEGVYPQGAVDATLSDPFRGQRNLEAIRKSFVNNELFDQSYGVEPATTQPMGPGFDAKLANTAFNINTNLKPKTFMPKSTTQMMGKTTPTNLRTAPIVPGINTTIKPTTLQNQITGSAASADMGTSYSAPMRNNPINNNQ